MTVTIVTALYDINRESKGDGRKFDEYLNWFKGTLKVSSPMVIFVDESLEEFVKEHRGSLPTKIITRSINDLPYYHLDEKIKSVIETDEYKQKMGCPDRVECTMSLYNVVIYSKFKWVKEAIKNNFFNTEYFMWMDAGLSRFFEGHGVDTRYPYPSHNGEEALEATKDTVLIHASMSYYPDLVNASEESEDTFWDARSWIMAGLWGGGKKVLNNFCDSIIDVLENKMLNNGVINNEQVAMAYVYKKHDDMFTVFENYAHMHRQYEIIGELQK